VDTPEDDAPVVGRNFIAEYFGHQVYPVMASADAALVDQRYGRCPFLTSALTVDKTCVKAATARGVCTVSTIVDGARYDWLVCQHRALDPTFMEIAARRIFHYTSDERLHFVAAPTLALPATRDLLTSALRSGDRVLVYFQEKLGGELSISKTESSPELSFDWTLLEVTAVEPNMRLGRFGILELQTMDFHGSYAHAVDLVQQRLHDDDFPSWIETIYGRAALSRKMEGPNLSNVFKRTFYQMAYKLQLSGHNDCAGTGFAVPRAVWQSWMRHLGSPELVDNGDGTHRLIPAPAEANDATSDAWIFVFELDEEANRTPRPLRMWRLIRIDPRTLMHLALTISPTAALAKGGPVDGVKDKALERVKKHWPEVVPRASKRRPR
jgi:hypothetical protein